MIFSCGKRLPVPAGIEEVKIDVRLEVRIGVRS
jgi:hypothetical protein